MQIERKQTQKEEEYNAIIHGVGALGALFGLGYLISLCIYRPHWIYIFSYVSYGITLICMYFASTLYHSIRPQKAKSVFERLDHVAIFYFIAGTFTPFCLITFKNNEFIGLWFLGGIWILAIINSIISIVWLQKIGIINLLMYIGMGLLAVVLVPPMYDTFGFSTVLLTALGGFSYLIGLVFFGFAKFKFSHAIWHGLVIAGSILHFMVITTFLK